MAKISTTDKDLGYKKFLNELEQIKGSYAKVGILESAEPYPNGQSVVEVGFWNEFGTDRIPERSFIRSTIDENRDDLNKFTKELMGQVATGKESFEKALGKIGFRIQSLIQKKILDLNDPVNADSTIARKGVNNPLVDSKHLWRNIAFEIVLAGDKNK